jgi:crotonobetainyl-CoA:carnitine CoA-transferase CaiB-like acyl-CoA transferase
VPEIGAPPRPLGADTDAVLRDYGFAAGEIDALKASGTIGVAKAER